MIRDRERAGRTHPALADRLKDPKRLHAGVAPRTALLRGRVLAAALLPVLAGGGCASAGKLGEYDFRNRSVAVVALNTPRPEILTNEELDVDLKSPLQTMLRIGADLVKEVEASRARPRLDSAARTVDVGGRMTERVLRGVAAELRAVPAVEPRTADFEVEVHVKRFGIDAETWLGPAEFFIESEVVLRETATGRRIWKGKVTEREPLTRPAASYLPPEGLATRPVNDVLTAAALSSLSAEEMSGMLEALSDFSADRILRNFRKGLEKARSR